ncbi:tRNA uracil 4-sulfurtransferase ThiI [Paraglaciecola aquimarina]|uniref:tRNA sulfurtransferase n=1 Tax=Paraglaciecola aquimarina TaxID=1235557 RepID=A0ABU3SVU4_9ALTE|nr:tRNA uracil 4-sulfurtransferase ThiI [Paraglaciecola aquimarina]MDU0354042.1 tRNA uracil 4-sulfurtransferase ThiI [Paraglaciecola aquimarina]
MQFIIRLHPEIIVKSRSVRKRFTFILAGNIRRIFKLNDLSVEVRQFWDKLTLIVNHRSIDKHVEIVDLLQRIPGIDQILQVEESTFTDLDDICQQIKHAWQPLLVGKSFVVRVKRSGKHPFSSLEAARYVGGYLNQNCDSQGVNLTSPDLIVEFEINQHKLIQRHNRIKCLGGMPLPTQDEVLSLMSGGYDSGVATYQMIRRGARTHFCFFNLGGREHEIGVKQVSYYLWKRYSESHRVKFIAVDFAPVVADILENVENSQMGVVLKRMMVRAASQVADKLNINALLTGESLGKVSSQTMTNLSVIDKATDKLILRPLICMDKFEIIDQAKHIGTEDFAKIMPEYCGVISRKPTTKAELAKIEMEESKLDFGMIERVVGEAKMRDIRTIIEDAEQETEFVTEVDILPRNSIVLDIRSAEEQEEAPLALSTVKVQHIPFFKLATQFPSLPQDKQYFLYCDRGVMSQLQALLLHEQGYDQVQVYRPKA